MREMKEWLVACMLGLSIINVAQAETAEEKGLVIAKEIDRRDMGWKDATADLRMSLRSRQGEESTRTIHLKILEVDGDGDMSLTIFGEPADVKGTAFLSYSHAVKPDDQWLYLPALKRVKRISSANKSGPFMGSEFAYEDLASFEVEKYRYNYLRDDKLDGQEVFVVEYLPRYENSGYIRQIVWIDKQRYIPLMVQYHDRKNDLLKTLRLKNYKHYLNKYWRAQEQVMENHLNGKSTLISLSEFKFHNGLSQRDFDSNNLSRVR